MEDKNEGSEATSEEPERTETRDSKKIKIKRPLSPVILPPSKKFLQLRRLSSSSEMTLPSLNGKFHTFSLAMFDLEIEVPECIVSYLFLKYEEHLSHSALLLEVVM